jgi:hypothetical protein
MNVGVSIKNIGNYLKTSLSRNTPDSALKALNNLNIKTNSSPVPSNYKNEKGLKRNLNSSLMHRHSNPTQGTYTPTERMSSTNHHHHHHHSSQRKNGSIQQVTNNIPEKTLPQIRVNT